MQPPSRPTRLGANRKLACALVMVLAAAAVVTLMTRGPTARATPGSPYGIYDALNSTEPSGLPLVTSHSRYLPGDPVGPTFPAQEPHDAGGGWPIASSIRRAIVNVPGISVWIAKSSAGGICVLLYNGKASHGISAVAASCSARDRLDRGATVESYGASGSSGDVLAAGVVPNGVTAVATQMADGSTNTVTVSDNAWARVTDGPPAGAR